MIIGAAALMLASCGRDPEPVAPEVPIAPATSDTPAADIAAPEAPSAPETLDPEASGGGEAHVHGAGEFAVAVDGDQLTVTLDAPLANFGLGEGDTDALEVSAGISDGLVSFEGGADCQPGDKHVTTRTVGDHSSLTLELGFTCADISKLEGVRLNAFTEFPHFETVEAVFIGPDAQVASVLTPGNPELSTQ
jgi:hypothetical protein